MNFDPSTAQEVGWEYSFDPSTAKLEFDPTTAEPAHDWGTTDARDSAKTNVSGMGAPERKGTSWERIKLSGEDAFAKNPTHGRPTLGIEKLKTASNMMKDLERDPFKTTTHLPHIEKLQKEGQEDIKRYILLRKGIDERMAEANPALWERVLGGAAGGLTDPINLLGVGNASTLPRTLAKQFFVGGGVGALAAIEQGDFDKAIDLVKDDPTIKELLDAGLTTGTISAILSGIFHVASKPSLSKGSTPKPDNVQTKAIADLEAQVAKTKADAEAKAKAEAYPELSPEFKTIDPLADQQARMATEVGDSVVPPAEGLPHIPGEVPADPAVKIASQNYPELDVQHPLVDNQYMTGKAQDITTAEQVGGVEKLDVNLNIPEGTIDNTVTPDVTRQVSTLNADRTVNPIQPQLASKLQKANNIGEALAAVAPHVPDEFKPLLAALDRVSDKSVPYKVHDWAPEFRRAALEDAVGAYRTPETGNTRIEVRGASYAIDGNKPHGVDVETTLHEIAHSVTDAAFRISNSELAADPKYAPHVQYVKDMSKLGRAIEDQVQRNVNKSGKAIELKGSLNSAWKESFKSGDAAEFNSYVWSSPEFRNFLRNVELDRYGKNAWEVFKDFFKKLLGQEVRTVSALKMADSFLDRLDQIQGVTKEDLKIAIAKDLTVSGDRFMKDIAEIKDGSELMNYVRGENVGDLGYAIVKDTPGLKQLVDVVNRYFTTTNQTARIFRHPILLFVAKHIPTIQRQAEARIQRYKEDLSTVIKLPRHDQLVLFKGLVDLQQPEFLDARRAAQEGGTREALLKQHGMPDHLVPEAIKVLDVMQDLYTNEQISAGRFNRGFPEAPMYFPRSHGGTFKFRIVDPSLPKDAQLIYIRGFKSPIEAQKFQTEMAARLKDNPNGWEVSPVERVDVPGYMDSLGDMMVEENLPDFLRAQVQDLNAKSMVSKRKFELERANKDIGGWIGQEVSLTDDSLFGPYHTENNRLLSLLNSRIDDSYRFEVNSRIISEIIDPIMHDPNNAMQRPRLNSMLNTIVLRELGYDTSKLKALVDQPLQDIVDDISKWINTNAAAKLYGYNPSDIPLVSPHSVKKSVQNAVWLTSAWKLGWNWPVILTNSTAIPLVINDGIRTASKEGVGYHIPALAYQKMFTAPFDKEAKSFMSQAELDGMITPRAADLFTITDQHGGALARRTTDTILNYARNQVEEWTNYTAILYYHNYYRLSQPDLKPNSDAFKSKVYQAARSHTGDYRSLATPQFISNMGLVGRGSGNFSKWVYNQTGRLLDDMVDIRENPAKFQSYMPIISNMAATVFAGGLYGMAGVADYEFLRMLGQKTGGWDWRPFSAWVEEVNKYAKRKDIPQVPDWMKRGAITEGSDQFVKAITDGQESGPDLSNTLRHAPFLQANTVMYDTFWNIVKEGLGSIGKKALELAEMGPGLSQQDEKNIAKALPTFMSPLLRDFMKEERKTNGKRQFITQAGTLEEGEYAQTNFERRMDLFNLKSKKQNTTTDYKQYQLWQERTKKEKISQLIGATLNPRNLHNEELVARNVKELVAVGGNVALDNLINQIQDRPFKRLTTYDERLVFSLIQQTDPAARQELIETIKKYQELK